MCRGCRNARVVIIDLLFDDTSSSDDESRGAEATALTGGL
jgi:hypothetical protein